ncbi:YwmB family TATA-box binding protein [Bacillus xiapuensis]|uniref:YwmB family TATA-box binding protein n=1 Tax=Bacillus xiapuensis TaxID=2014075 RepID=UPI0012FD9D60|nr:YwmB family TATA-box binding protein [Bacillus xiapuensis]
MKQTKKWMCILFICFIAMIYGNNTTAGSQIDSLLVLTDAVQKENGHIEEWSIHIREHLTAEESEAAAAKLQSYLSGWTFSKGNEMEWLTAKQEEQKLRQKFQLLSTDAADDTYILQYTVTSADEKQIRTFIKQQLEEIMLEIFHKNPRVFTCLKGSFDGKIEEVLPNQLRALVTGLEAKELEAVTEKGFYSVSAYSKLFNESLPLPSHQMNLQIGLRKKGLGAETNFVIGTPIITVEY